METLCFSELELLFQEGYPKAQGRKWEVPNLAYQMESVYSGMYLVWAHATLHLKKQQAEHGNRCLLRG